MIVHPKLPENPYNFSQLQSLVEKYQKVTNNPASSFIRKIEDIIEDNFTEDEILDHAMIDSLRNIFIFNNRASPQSEIFLHSVLKEALHHTIYHPVKELKILLKSIKY